MASHPPVPLDETQGRQLEHRVGTEAAGRVIDVLLLFTSGPSTLGVSAIARQLGLSKAVVHRILRTLTTRQVVAFDSATRGYRLGPAVAALGARALRDSDLRSAALPVLRELRDVTGETTTLSELVDGSRVYLDQCESPHGIKMTVEIGRRFPLHAGASSQAILAFLPDEQRRQQLSRPLETLTSRTLADPDALERRLDSVRAEFVATTFGERQNGAASLASPVLGVDGHVVGAISVCGPISRFDDATCSAYSPLVRRAAVRISQEIGWNAPDGEPVASQGTTAGRTVGRHPGVKERS